MCPCSRSQRVSPQCATKLDVMPVLVSRVLLCCLIAGASAVNPLSKVISLLEDLHEKVSADAASDVDASKAYREWCTEKARDDGHQHDSLEVEIAALNAEIQKVMAEKEKTQLSIKALSSRSDRPDGAEGGQ